MKTLKSFADLPVTPDMVFFSDLENAVLISKPEVEQE